VEGGVKHLLSDTVAAIDPLSFKPRKPLSDNHHFARGQQIFFEALQKGIRRYFDAHWEEMTKDWTPIHEFFGDLFSKSPLFRPWNGEDVASAKWVDALEIGGQVDGLPERRKLRDGDAGVRSFRPIARNPKAPSPSDREHIEKFVVHYIFTVTFYHSWIHEKQYRQSDFFPAVADPNFAPITTRDQGSGPHGGIPEAIAKQQLELAATFKQFETDHYLLLDSPDVCDEIKEEVRNVKDDLLAVGFDVETDLLYGTVI
jgi:hypothetical protein